MCGSVSGSSNTAIASGAGCGGGGGAPADAVGQLGEGLPGSTAPAAAADGSTSGGGDLIVPSPASPDEASAAAGSPAMAGAHQLGSSPTGAAPYIDPVDPTRAAPPAKASKPASAKRGVPLPTGGGTAPAPAPGGRAASTAKPGGTAAPAGPRSTGGGSAWPAGAPPMEAFLELGATPKEVQMLASQGFTARDLKAILAEVKAQTKAQASASGGTAAAHKPGWNATWEREFTKAMRDLGLDPAFVKLAVADLKRSGAPTEVLRTTLRDINSDPAAQARLRQVERQYVAQVEAGKPPKELEVAAKIGMAVAGGYAASSTVSRALAVVAGRDGRFAARAKKALAHMPDRYAARARVDLGVGRKGVELGRSRAADGLRQLELRRSAKSGIGVSQLDDLARTGRESNLGDLVRAEAKRANIDVAGKNTTQIARELAESKGVKNVARMNASQATTAYSRANGVNLSPSAAKALRDLPGGASAADELGAAGRNTSAMRHPVERLRAASANARTTPVWQAMNNGSTETARFSERARNLPKGLRSGITAGGPASLADDAARGAKAANAAKTAAHGIGLTGATKFAKSNAVLAGVITGAVEGKAAWDVYKKEGHFGKETSKATGTAVGGAGGAVAGALVGAKLGGIGGAAVGSLLGPPGAAVGGAIGVIGGSIVGSIVGAEAGKKIGDSVGGAAHDLASGAKDFVGDIDLNPFS